MPQKEYKQRVGSRAQVMHGTAKMTGGGLKKKQLKYNKHGKIVSRKASKAAKKTKNLQKAGYFTKKGQFGAYRKMGRKGKVMRGGGFTQGEREKARKALVEYGLISNFQFDQFEIQYNIELDNKPFDSNSFIYYVNNELHKSANKIPKDLQGIGFIDATLKKLMDMGISKKKIFDTVRRTGETTADGILEAIAVAEGKDEYGNYGAKEKYDDGYYGAEGKDADGNKGAEGDDVKPPGGPYDITIADLAKNNAKVNFAMDFLDLDDNFTKKTWNKVKRKKLFGYHANRTKNKDARDIFAIVTEADTLLNDPQLLGMVGFISNNNEDRSNVTRSKLENPDYLDGKQEYKAYYNYEFRKIQMNIGI